VQRVLSRAAGVPPAAAWGLAAAGLFAGAAVALAGANALVLCAALLGCAFILLDFRVGVVLLIVLMPLSRSAMFPHAMFGITGLNPVNLLLAGTLGACVLQRLGGGALRGFVPRPLLWLYLAPLAAAAVLGLRHVDEIVPGFYEFGLIQFHNAAGYLRDMLFKPLLLVVFALLVAAAARRSARPEALLAPACLSIWVMAALVLGFVALSGAGLGQLAASGARAFLSPLGIHANDLGRLEREGYAVLTARDSSGARKVCREQNGRIDLMVTDLVMPRGDGVSLADAVREEFPDIRILLMSGFADRALERRGPRAAVYPLLTKPFASDELVMRVREILDGE
jgi:CheY-like chemotaxis protein